MKYRRRVAMDVDEFRAQEQGQQLRYSRTVCRVLQKQPSTWVKRCQFCQVISKGVSPQPNGLVVCTREQDFLREYGSHLLREIDTIEKGRGTHRGKGELLLLRRFGIEPHIVHRTGPRKKLQNDAASDKVERVGIEVVWPQHIDDRGKAETGILAHQIVQKRSTAAPMPDDENRRRIERHSLYSARNTQCLDCASRPTQEGTREDDRDLHVRAR